MDALALLMPNPNSRLFGGASREWLTQLPDGFAENAASLPWVALAVILLASRYRPLPPRWKFLTLTFALVSLGPFIGVGGVNTRIPTPWALLRYAPLVGLVRSPGRLAVVTILALSVLFAFAVSELRRRFPLRSRLLLGAIGVALILELAPMPRPLFSAEVSRVFHTIAADPRRIRVLELPTGLRDGTSSMGQYSAVTQFHQTIHGKAVVGGYLSRVSARRVQACRRFPVLDALFIASAGKTLTVEQRLLAFRYRARFLRRSRLGYVVIDTSRASDHLRRLAIRLLGLVKIDEDGVYQLYVPDVAALEPDDERIPELGVRRSARRP